MSSGSTLRDLLRRGRATFAAKTAVLCDLRIVISLPSGNLISPWKPWSIEIDGLPIKNGDFPWLC